MSVAPPGSPLAGTLSPDGQWYWDGARWVSSLSPDGMYRWNGSAWTATAPSMAAPAGPAWARAYASPRGRSLFVLISFAVLLVSYGLTTAADLLAASMKGAGPLTADQKAFLDLAQGLPALLSLGALVATIVAFCMWLHRLYRNLPALGATGLRYSPGWAAGAWFVPILNLWRPYQIVREVWQRTAPAGQGWDLLKLWWGLWLVSNYVGNFVFRQDFVSGAASDALDAASNVVDALAAIAAVLIVMRLTAWQRQKAGEPA